MVRGMTAPRDPNSPLGAASSRKTVASGRATQSKASNNKDRGDGTAEPRHIDEVDQRIITLLTGDARLSARAIARELGMSPGAISERIDRLETGGIITGYHASVDIAALGYPMRAIVGVSVVRGGEALAGVVEQLMGIRNVQTVKLVTGQWDLLVEIVVRDNAQLREILVDAISATPGVTATQTMITLSTVQRPGSWSPS
jgi:Lrp/AsnC family leucine-responsive transcriptional regulator